MSLYWWAASAPTLAFAAAAALAATCAWRLELVDSESVVEVDRLTRPLAALAVLGALAQPLLRAHALPVTTALFYPSVAPRWALVVLTALVALGPTWRTATPRARTLAVSLIAAVMVMVAP